MVRRSLFVFVLAPVVLVASCGRIGYGYDHELVVTSAEDTDSPTTLRGALDVAASLPGTTRIRFDRDVFPSGRPTVVAVASPLPEVTDDTTVDGSGSGVVIEVGGATEPLLRGGGSGVIIRGLTFRNLMGPALEVTVDGMRVEDNHFEGITGDAIVVTGAHDVIIRHNTILDTSGRAVAATSCARLLIEDNTIERAGSALVSIADCTQVSIRDNFMNIGDKETQQGVSFERVTSSEICDNIIDPGDARLVNFLDSSQNIVCRNILDRGDAGVVLEGVSTRNLIFQNVAITMVYDGVYLGAEATGNIVVHNTFYDCSTAIADASPDAVLLNNLVTADPAIFVAPAPPTYDFTLVEGNESIDAGEDVDYDCVPSSPVDYLGRARDLGAVESY